MSWFCSFCEKSFSRKDSMQRHVMSKHRNAGFTPFRAMPFSVEKCQRFQFVHPFTCMVAGMTGSGKTVWVKSLLQQAQRAINLPPERIVWCYSQWQPGYLELMAIMPNIEFIRGIPSNLEHDSYFDIHQRNLMVIDDQMADAGEDKRIVNLFTRGSHHRNLSIIYIVQNLFHQGKGSRSISLNSHYLVLFKNPRDKLQVLTLAKQMYPRHTDFFINHYEQAVQRHFGYLLVDLKTTTQDNCRLRTNVLPGEERFDNVAVPDNISQELLQYLKQQNVMTPPVVPVMKKLQDSMDGLLSRSDLGDDERAKHYMQLQNKYLTFKQQLNARLKESNPPYSEEQRQISSNHMPDQEPVTVQAAAVQTPTVIQATAAQEPIATQATPAEASLPSSILTPPPTVPSPTQKRKKPPRIRFKNYLDDDDRPSRRSRRTHRNHPYKASQEDEF